jgi:putative restriction endonuclease
MYGEPALVRPRLGQGTFRVLVSDAYERKCVITGEKTLPVLEASHIRPVSLGGQHRIDNGLLLRSDIHTLFDMGYVTITPKMEFKVSSKLREEWQNGVIYYTLAGNSIRTPKSEVFKPRAEFLEWHNDTVFRS